MKRGNSHGSGSKDVVAARSLRGSNASLAHSIQGGQNAIAQ